MTGTSYEQGNRITGPFDMAGGKVTGTEQFRFDNREFQNRQQRQFQPTVAVVSEPSEKPASRVTGEGSSTKITGDDWDRGEHVTGTEGASARRRNPSSSWPDECHVFLRAQAQRGDRMACEPRDRFQRQHREGFPDHRLRRRTGLIH